MSKVNNGAEYTKEELEFMDAVQKFKQDQKCRFPALTDYLDILKSLGYVRQTQGEEKNINYLLSDLG